MSRKLFLDTSYAIALFVPADRHHPRARELADMLQRDHFRVVTTRAVLLEIGNALSKPLQREVGAQFLNALENDRRVEIVPLSNELYHDGLKLFSGRRDKSWSLVDCISFEVMREHAVNDSLTSDGHFEQAGFRALLRAS